MARLCFMPRPAASSPSTPGSLDAPSWPLAKNIIKAELKRRGMSYRDLAAKLEGAGIHETERNLANKISRGGFSAAFFLECLDAAGCRQVSITSE